MTVSATCATDVSFSRSHFTGKERDAESGLDYFHARYLTSDLGRFMTPDWADKPTAVPYAQYGDPQSLNLYTYVLNNPNSGIDEDGHIDWGYLEDKFNAIFYTKVGASVGVGLGVKLTKNVEAKAAARAGVEVKKTSTGATATAKVEAGAGIKIGEKEVGAKASAEVQVMKDGKVDIANPKVECCAPTGNAGHVEATPNEVEVSGHSGGVDAAVGADLGKAQEFIDAVKEQVNAEIDKAVQKFTPPSQH